MKNYTGPNQENMANVLTLFASIGLLNVLYRKMHCHDAQVTSPNKEIAFLDQFATVCVANFESSMLVSLFLLGKQIHNG
jgi:hypothetical protein